MEDEDEDVHDFVDAKSCSSLSEASPLVEERLSEASPLVEERPGIKLRAVAEHDYASDNPKVEHVIIMDRCY